MSKFTRSLGKLAKFKPKNKQIMKEVKKVTIKTDQPVYSDDKNRFFKEVWKEEKRQLYFK